MESESERKADVRRSWVALLESSVEEVKRMVLFKKYDHALTAVDGMEKMIELGKALLLRESKDHQPVDYETRWWLRPEAAQIFIENVYRMLLYGDQWNHGRRRLFESPALSMVVSSQYAGLYLQLINSMGLPSVRLTARRTAELADREKLVDAIRMLVGTPQSATLMRLQMDVQIALGLHADGNGVVKVGQRPLATVTFIRTKKGKKSSKKKDEPLNKKELLRKKLSSCEFSLNAEVALKEAGLKCVGDLVRMSDADLLKLKVFGRPFSRKHLDEVKNLLAEMGLSLKK